MKIKQIVLATAAASALLASSSVFAIGASQGWYLAGQLGGAFNNLPSSQSGVKISSNDFAWGVNGGYNYQLQSSRFLIGGEIGINGLGSNSATPPASSKNTDTYYAVNFLGTATYAQQLGQNDSKVYVWAETGPSLAWTTASTSIAGESFANSESTMAWVLGAGLGYEWNKWNVFVRYDHYFGDNFAPGFKFPKINAVFGGISYTF